MLSGLPWMWLARSTANSSAGASRAEALRNTQRELSARYPAPYYRAAFTLSGRTGPLEP